MTSTAGSTKTTGEPADKAAPGDAASPADRPGDVRRFSRAERLVHRTTGWLMLLCVFSGACLYLPALGHLVGRRHLAVVVHEWSGILLPVPFLLGLASPAFRADLRRLNRFATYDRAWLRAVRKRWAAPGSRPAGKFNAGQKVYAGWIAGAVLVMMFTGLLMWFSGILRTISRTSVIFVHDYLALSILIVLAGHITLAYRDPEARRGMRTGLVSRSWAKWEHPRWRHEEPPTAGTVAANLESKEGPRMAGDDGISG